MTDVYPCSHVAHGQAVVRALPIFEGMRVELCAACLVKLRNEAKRPV